MLAQFTPIETFQALICGYRNNYLKGATYHIRDGNSQLLKTALRWRQEGMVVLTMLEYEQSMGTQPAMTTGIVKVT